jgi:nucleoside-diphosphate-sugar epimerase
MRELARKIWEKCDRDREIVFETESEFKHDVQKRIPDSSKAAESLDWKPKVTLDEALNEYISWYKSEEFL